MNPWPKNLHMHESLKQGPSVQEQLAVCVTLMQIWSEQVFDEPLQNWCIARREFLSPSPAHMLDMHEP